MFVTANSFINVAVIYFNSRHDLGVKNIFLITSLTWRSCSLCTACRSPCKRAACTCLRPAVWRPCRGECVPVRRCTRAVRCRAAWALCRRCAVRRPSAWGTAQTPVASTASCRRLSWTRPLSGHGTRPTCTR